LNADLHRISITQTILFPGDSRKETTKEQHLQARANAVKRLHITSKRCIQTNIQLKPNMCVTAMQPGKISHN
jgi:hypothetical protein